jgi:pyroglutamyl-peptidase
MGQGRRDTLDGVKKTVVAFEPFFGRRRNRSWEVVRRLPAEDGLRRGLLPVDFARLGPAVRDLLGESPDVLLFVGETSARRVAVEQLALNVADSPDPDNAGRSPNRETLVAGAPLAVEVPWDASRIARVLADVGVEARASFHAGTFVCNAALYLALREASETTSVGFLHVPRRRWPRGPRLPELLRAVQVAVEALGAPSNARDFTPQST